MNDWYSTWGQFLQLQANLLQEPPYNPGKGGGEVFKKFFLADSAWNKQYILGTVLYEHVIKFKIFTRRLEINTTDTPASSDFNPPPPPQWRLIGGPLKAEVP